MIDLYSLSTCTYFQWDKSYQIFSVVQRKFKIDSPAGFMQRIRTMPKLLFVCFLPFSLLLCKKVSDIEGHPSQLQDCGSSLSNSSLNNNFLQLNLALPGETPSSPESSGRRVVCVVLSKTSLSSPPQIAHYGPDHLALLPALSLSKTK